VYGSKFQNKSRRWQPQQIFKSERTCLLPASCDAGKNESHVLPDRFVYSQINGGKVQFWSVDGAHFHDGRFLRPYQVNRLDWQEKNGACPVNLGLVAIYLLYTH
jgi:hypothetical protein